MQSASALNTLQYDGTLCVNCGLCSTVCPHAVFESGEKKAVLKHPDDCMECGACMLNCPTHAILVDSGVGCAYALIRSAITGKEESCGCDEDGKSSCCNG
jgi:NAD-dependent dihydropyrimidine dehydrogenase PreA subunit